MCESSGPYSIVSVQFLHHAHTQTQYLLKAAPGEVSDKYSTIHAIFVSHEPWKRHRSHREKLRTSH